MPDSSNMSPNALACASSAAPGACTWFWDKMDQWTKVRPLTEAEKSKYEQKSKGDWANKLEQNLDTVKEFVGDIEQMAPGDPAAKAFADRLSKALVVFQQAFGAGKDAADAAAEVQTILQDFYLRADKACKQSATNSDGQIDDVLYTDCLVRSERKWQARSVKAVLDDDDPDSWASKVWSKWKRRLLDLLSPV